MNNLAIALALIGLTLLFSVDTFISKNTDNTVLKSIHDNNMMIGAGCLGLSYYLYNNDLKHAASPVLPTYEEVTATATTSV